MQLYLSLQIALNFNFPPFLDPRNQQKIIKIIKTQSFFTKEKIRLVTPKVFHQLTRHANVRRKNIRRLSFSLIGVLACYTT
jgi:hypothetical protein